jgi:hypothetical protein
MADAQPLVRLRDKKWRLYFAGMNDRAAVLFD